MCIYVCITESLYIYKCTYIYVHRTVCITESDRGWFRATVLSQVCDLCYSSWQPFIFNSLRGPRDQTLSSWLLVGFIFTKPQQELLKDNFIKQSRRKVFQTTHTVGLLVSDPKVLGWGVRKVLFSSYRIGQLYLSLKENFNRRATLAYLSTTLHVICIKANGKEIKVSNSKIKEIC